MVTGERFQEIIEAARRVAGPPVDLEQALQLMRSEGMSPTESIKGLIAIADMPLAEAKRVLHLSDTWADMRDDQERFQQALADEAEREL